MIHEIRIFRLNSSSRRVLYSATFALTCQQDDRCSGSSRKQKADYWCAGNHRKQERAKYS